MDENQQKEMYELTRQAIHDELYGIVSDAVVTVVGCMTIYFGLAIFINAPLGQPFVSPTRLLGAGFVLLGILMIGILWKWDRLVYNHLPSGR